MLSSYLTRIFVCNIVVSREMSSALEVGIGSSVGGGGDDMIVVGELGAEPEAVCRLREDRDLIILVALLSAVRKSSTIGIVRECDGIHVLAPTFAE